MLNQSFLAYLMGRGNQFQPYGAGPKRYGPTGRTSPNIGPVGDLGGYRQRDAMAQAKRNAMLAKLQAGQKGNFMSKAYLSPASKARIQ